MKKQEINIFEVLGKISTKQCTFYQQMTEEQRKEVVPFVLMRWLTGTSDRRQIVFLNEFANPYVFSLADHKPLLVKLLMACTSGKGQRYKWIPNKRTSHKRPISVQVIQDYFKYSSSEASEAVKLLNGQDVIDYAGQLGYQKDVLTKIKKEWKE